MCEAKVFLIEDHTTQPLMKDVVLIQPEGDAYLLANLIGEQKLVRGRIVKIDFLRHVVQLEPLETEANTA
jgi:predicted RNA-binding protein